MHIDEIAISSRSGTLAQMGAPPTPVRVVVADDSAVMRRLIKDALTSTGQIEIVGEAADGSEAEALCRTLNPDVLTLDLSMPHTTGLDVLASLKQTRSRVRVVVVSSFSPTLVERALDVLEAGAADLVAKPKPGDSFQEFAQLVRTSVLTTSAGGAAAISTSAPATLVPRTTRAGTDEGRVLVIASSTGGPRALGDLIPKLGGSVGRGGVIVQHMPPGFTTALARRLNDASDVSVREAETGDALEHGTLFVAPAGHHLRFSAERFWLDHADPIGGIRPRADLTIRDLADHFGPRVVLVVLTGMGNDGLDGARAVREGGGIILAQDESDCVVYGMPRHVVEQDLADATGSIAQLGILIERALATPVR